LPARWGPGVPAPVGPELGDIGLTMDIAGCSDEDEIMTLTLGVTVHEPKVTGVVESIERRSSFPDASVDQTEVRNAAGCGPDDCTVHRGRNRARRSGKVRRWDRTDQRPPHGSATSSA